ncbi:MAG: hypothetical protein Q4Q53_05170 [Methanocorpusculum sp.]|nr:hypothetical protein [Methanocorpusculum sp.]
MAEKKRYETIKRKKKSPAVLIAIVVFILAAAVIGVIAGFFALSGLVGNIVDSSDILMTCTVSGNDIAVKLMKSEHSDNLVNLEVVLEGYEIPKGYSIKEIPVGDYPKTIIYENIAAGITGVKQVSIRGLFKDGTSKIIWMSSLKMT